MQYHTAAKIKSCACCLRLGRGELLLLLRHEWTMARLPDRFLLKVQPTRVVAISVA